MACWYDLVFMLWYKWSLHKNSLLYNGFKFEPTTSHSWVIYLTTKQGVSCNKSFVSVSVLIQVQTLDQIERDFLDVRNRAARLERKRVLVETMLAQVQR